MSTNGSSKPTGFSSLPAELRNQIYSLALNDSPVIRITNSSAAVPSLPLLAASPQIRSEAGAMRWSHSSVHFDLTASDIYHNAPFASQWLTALGTSRVRYLKELTISLSDRFSITLGHKMLATGHPALVLKNLTIAKDQPWNRPGIPVWSGSETPHDLTPIRASISSALEAMYSNRSLDLASYTEHNLVPGLAQFLLSTSSTFRWRFDPACASALQFITGATKFYEVWLNGRFMAHDARSEVQAERERVAWEGSEAEVDPEPVVLADVRVVGSMEKWHGCGLRMGQFWTRM